MALFRGELLKEITVREIRDGVVFGREGEVHIGFDLYFPSSRLLTARERAVISRELGKVVRQVVPIGGWARLYVEALEGGLAIPPDYLDALSKADPLIREINEAKLDVLRLQAAEGRLRQWNVFLEVAFTPSYVKKAKESYSKEEYAGVMAEVEQIRESVLNILEKVGIQARPMGDDDLEAFLFRYFNPSLKERRPSPKDPSVPDVARLALSAVENRQDKFIRVGGVYITHVVMHKGPRYTQPGLLDILLTVPGEFLLVIEVRHVDQADASAKLNLVRVRLESVSQDLGSRADPELAEKAKIMGKALTRRAQTAEHVVEVGVQMVLRSKDLALLQSRAREAYGKAQSLADATVVAMPPNAFDYWLKAAPFSGKPLVRKWNYLDLNAAQMVPIQMPWRGSPAPIAFYLSKEGTMVGVNPFDPRAPAWNGILVGGTGSGKTFFTQSYITSFLTKGDFVAIIDKGGGYVPLTELLGGAIIYFEPGAEVTVNPFDLPEGQVEPDEVKKAFLVTLLRQMIPSRGDPVKEQVILTAAVERVYQAFQYRERLPDGGERITLRTPTLSDFRSILRSMDEAFGQHLEEADKDLIRSMAQALALWTGDTPYGRLVDGQTNIDLNSRVVYFETTGISLNEDLQRVGLLLLMDLLWRRIARDPAERKMLIFDEVWSLLASPSAAAFVEDLYRRLRRYGASALSISQSLGDFVSGNAKGIVENANYFFLLAAQNQTPFLKNVLKLPDDIIEAYETLKPKGEILFLLRILGRFQGEVLQYIPSPYEVAAFGTQADEQVQRRELKQEFGSLPAAVRYLHLQGMLEKASKK